MRHFFSQLWFKITGNYHKTVTTSEMPNGMQEPFQHVKKIGGIDLRSLGIETVRDLDERDIHPHIFQERAEIAENMSFEESTKYSLPSDQQPIPEVTVGSILTWGLIKTAILVVTMWFVIERFRWHEYWFVGLGIFWFLVAYPAFLQYQRFKAQTVHLEKSSLCATCRHFDETGHFCRLMDEHISETYIPCEGLSWEGKERF